MIWNKEPEAGKCLGRNSAVGRSVNEWVGYPHRQALHSLRVSGNRRAGWQVEWQYVVVLQTGDWSSGSRKNSWRMSGVQLKNWAQSWKERWRLGHKEGYKMLRSEVNGSWTTEICWDEGPFYFWARMKLTMGAKWPHIWNLEGFQEK